jgi:DNA-binding CsgD family transcriptional regulator
MTRGRRTVLIVMVYGAVLALGAILLQWLEYRFVMRTHAREAYALLVALGFLALGIWAGLRLTPRAPAAPFTVNRAALVTLRISDRELQVLELLAEGRANKDIARRLELSPHTVKTHLANLFEKLGAGRRTEAIARARELGLIR